MQGAQERGLSMSWMRLRLFLVVAIVMLSGLSMNDVCSWAKDEPQSVQEKKGEEKTVPQDGEEKVSKTDHTLIIDGKELRYRTVAGDLFIKQENGNAKGKVFYIAHELEKAEHSGRPVTFVFNGGPGAASVWLHLGGLGPKRISLKPNGEPLPPPVRYGDNPYTWLTFTDLVFVDPMGTGFSRSTPDDEKTSRAFYGVQQDIQSVAEFIRLYLTRNSRWISPKFLVGESYGTTRVSGLTWHLQQRYGIDLNGVVLISPVLDFDTILFHPSHDLPYVLFLPTYAATVAY
ncbi:MAG TPA: hypothetical protein DCP92_15395, partial [Nitrospiraceae bacterium]|nr:hypothetical protein [Nitrospiraceae bacterium]